MRRPMQAMQGLPLAAAVMMFIAQLAVPRAQQGGAVPAPQGGPAPTQGQATPAQGSAPAAPAQGTPRPGGQPAGQGAPAPGTPATPAKPLVPVAASTLAAHPDTYYGEHVTVSAAVDQVLGKSAFSVDQDPTKSTGKDVLVVTKALYGTVDPNAYVTVIGEAVKFDDLTTKFKDLKLDLPADAAARYKGRPVVVATSVVNGAFVDLAKRLPPPMTADDEALSKVMKKIGPALAATRTAVDGSKTEDVTKNIAVLKQSFAETEAFWKSKGRRDAVEWAADANKQIALIERGAATGQWDKAKAAAGTLGQSCQGCHTAYRDRFDDGSFRIKMPATPQKSGTQ